MRDAGAAEGDLYFLCLKAPVGNGGLEFMGTFRKRVFRHRKALIVKAEIVLWFVSRGENESLTSKNPSSR